MRCWCSWVYAGDLFGRDVVVYRLITCGTVEEKIYRRQVFKGGLSRAGTRDEEQLRYFSYVVRPLCRRFDCPCCEHDTKYVQTCICTRSLQLATMLWSCGAGPLEGQCCVHKQSVRGGAQQQEVCSDPNTRATICAVRQELRDLFSLRPEEVGASRTQADLSARHAAQRRTTPALDAHLAQLPRLPNYVGAPPPASHMCS